MGNQGIADLDMHAPGIWCFNTGCKNAPCDKGLLLCMTSNTWTVQLAIQIYTSAAYVRSKGGAGGRFTEWARL